MKLCHVCLRTKGAISLRALVSPLLKWKLGQSLSLCKTIVRTILSSENQKQLFIPRGCAHGFVTLSETATFFYKCDNFYNKASEGGVLYNDSELNIDWVLDTSELIISDKDKILPTLNEFVAD